MSMFNGAVLLSALIVAGSVSSTVEAGMLSGLRSSLRYSGSWISHHNGHKGLLKARVKQQDCRTYRVRFCGTFLGVIPFVYSTPMTVTGRCDNGDVMLYGRSRLPLFGEFTSHARMNECSFNATYRSESDHGRFVMSRN